VLICLKTETGPAPEILCLFKKLDVGQTLKNKICQLTSAVLWSLFWISWH